MKVVFTCVCECARVLFFFCYSRIPLLIFLLLLLLRLLLVSVVPFVFLGTRASPAVKGTTVVFSPFSSIFYSYFFPVCRRPAVDTALDVGGGGSFVRTTTRRSAANSSAKSDSERISPICPLAPSCRPENTALVLRRLPVRNRLLQQFANNALFDVNPKFSNQFIIVISL